MKWVDQAVTRPHRCAVVPYVGNGSGHMFLDTDQDLDLEHVYISDVGAEVIAKALGWIPAEQLEQARRQIADLESENEQLEAQLQEADRFAEAAEYTLNKFGSKVRQKPGPKPREKVA